MSRRPSYAGLTREKPLLLGQPNGAPPRFVVATGLVLGVRINEQRWVTGDAVDGVIARGSLVEIAFEPAGQRPSPPAPDPAPQQPPVAAADPVAPSAPVEAQTAPQRPAKATAKPAVGLAEGDPPL